MIEKRLWDLWDGLQGRKAYFRSFLHEVRIENLRGIADLRVAFNYPVSVIAGGNASGKSTVLFATACAYKTPRAKSRRLAPSTLFPSHLSKSGEWHDERSAVTLDFDYSTPEGRLPMRWRRSKGWSRSFFGRPNAKQPERDVYLRTLSNLNNPPEKRSMLSMARLRTEAESTPLNASQVNFAQQMLPFRYKTIVNLSSGSKNMLFAKHNGPRYSELHMSAGERAILHLAKAIAQLKNALILIDEVEAGLHPWGQRMLMLQLQQLALRNDLQIIVTTHSPVVLDTVPQYGRIFLDRDEETGQVSVQPPYHDLIRNALYGQPQGTLNLLCEDAVAEGVLLGISDHLQIRGDVRPGTVQVGCNTGVRDFPAHAKTLGKFNQLQNFVFVLGGNQRDGEAKKELERKAGVDARRMMFLPGSGAPEVWVWNRLRQVAARDTAPDLGVNPADLRQTMARQDQIYDSAVDTPTAIAKVKLQALADSLQQDVITICRELARWETTQKDSELLPLLRELGRTLRSWRTELEG